jgi:hypothetical protein
MKCNRSGTSVTANSSMIVTIGEWIMGKGILLWLLGVPIPVILLLALFWH